MSHSLVKPELEKVLTTKKLNEKENTKFSNTKFSRKFSVTTNNVKLSTSILPTPKLLRVTLP